MNRLEVDGQYYKVLKMIQEAGSEKIIHNVIENIKKDRIQSGARISKRTIEELQKDICEFEKTVSK